MKKKVIYSLLFIVSIFSITNVKAANIESSFKYDDVNDATKCITGEETTCVKSECINSTNANSCEPGTIIMYKVNNTVKHAFYVLHDDGNKLTLIQRENTVDGVEYYEPTDSIFSLGDNKYGPVKAMESLNTATSDWSNVNSLTLKMGETSISGNSFTGCTYSNNLYSCNINTYNWSESTTTKARLITVTEALNAGATSTVGKSFLKNSTNYWTMNGLADENNNQAIYILSTGALYYGYTEDKIGLRAVIEINKESINNTTSQNNKNETNSNGQTSNKNQVVKVENTGLTVSIMGYIIGLAILLTGCYCIYQSLGTKKLDK